MKVIIKDDVFLVHWETQKFSPQEGRNVDLELEATDCIIRKVDENDDLVIISQGHASQTSGDKANRVTGRRLSFLYAIRYLDRPIRKALGHEYNRTCRVTPLSMFQKNRKLRKRISELTVLLKKAEAEAVIA